MLSTSLAKICVYTHTHTHTHTQATVPRKRQESESPTPHPLPRNVHKSPGHFLKAQSRNDCLKACHKILQFCFQAWWVLCHGACSRGERSHWPGVDPHCPVKLSATSAGHMECRCAQVNPAGPGQQYLPLCHFPHHHPPPLIPSRWHPLIPTKMPTEPATPRAPSAWQGCKWTYLLFLQDHEWKSCICFFVFFYETFPTELFYFFYCSGFCHTLKWNSHVFTCAFVFYVCLSQAWQPTHPRREQGSSIFRALLWICGSLPEKTMKKNMSTGGHPSHIILT